MAKSDYTHYASMYGIPCLFNEYTNEIAGKNIFYDFILAVIVAIDINVPSDKEGFEIKIIKEIK